VVGGGLLDLRLDLLDAGLDGVGIAGAVGLNGAVDDRAVLLRGHDFLGTAQILDGRLLKLQADFFGAAGLGQGDRIDPPRSAEAFGFYESPIPNPKSRRAAAISR
jgi:hypothetical protein